MAAQPEPAKKAEMDMQRMALSKAIEEMLAIGFDRCAHLPVQHGCTIRKPSLR
jgi:hypothetical protein